MHSGMYLGFDFGYKRIGVAVGQSITQSARPLKTVPADQGVPQWPMIDVIVKDWQPEAMIVGYPRCIDGTEQYTTTAAKDFAKALASRYDCPVHLVDERLTTVEARQQLFEQGGYKRLQSSEIDAIAAVLILEQWLHHPSSGVS
jgi:putative pre-16S rRNA nuclease